MKMMLSPATMADKPARRMRVDAVIFALFSLIPVWRLVSASLTPLLVAVVPDWFIFSLFDIVFSFLNIINNLWNLTLIGKRSLFALIFTLHKVSIVFLLWWKPLCWFLLWKVIRAGITGFGKINQYCVLIYAIMKGLSVRLMRKHCGHPTKNKQKANPCHQPCGATTMFRFDESSNSSEPSSHRIWDIRRELRKQKTIKLWLNKLAPYQGPTDAGFVVFSPGTLYDAKRAQAIKSGSRVSANEKAEVYHYCPN